MTKTCRRSRTACGFVPDELGWAWAAHLQGRSRGRWLVRWEPGSQHFTAFYLGDTDEDGAYRKARTPRGMWEHMLAFDPSHPQIAPDCGDPVDDASAWQPHIGPARASSPPEGAGDEAVLSRPSGTKLRYLARSGRSTRPSDSRAPLNQGAS
jgi:hypothetical protein